MIFAINTTTNPAITYTNLNPQSFTTANFSPEYAKYSSDEEDEDDEVLGEPFMKERDVDEQEMDKVLL